MPRAQGCAGAACLSLARQFDVRRDSLSYAQHIERYAAGAGMRTTTQLPTNPN
jgi:hypothetical protein